MLSDHFFPQFASSFFCRRWCLAGWQWKEFGLQWCDPTISALSYWRWLWGFSTDQFLVWWYLALLKWWCSLCRRCRDWFGNVTFIILRFFTVILVLLSKIRRFTEEMKIPDQAKIIIVQISLYCAHTDSDIDQRALENRRGHSTICLSLPNLMSTWSCSYFSRRANSWFQCRHIKRLSIVKNLSHSGDVNSK